MATDTISGFCLLSMPSDQVKPLGILTSEKGFVADTTAIMLKDIFIKSSQGLPVIKKNGNLSSTINKSVTVELSVDSNLNLLQELLKFLKLSFSFKLEKNKALKLHMIDPKIDSANEFQLDAYINSAIVNTNAPTYTGMLQKNQLYVVSNILKCRKYGLEYVSSNKSDTVGQAAVPATVEAKAGIHTSNSDNDVATYEGDDFITIGVKAYQILCIKDEYSGKVSYRIRKDEKIKTIKGDEGFPGNLLKAQKINISNS